VSATFTPFVEGERQVASGDASDTRLALNVDLRLMEIDGFGPEEGQVVVDRDSGKRFLLWRSACGLGCHCAATVRPLDGLDGVGWLRDTLPATDAGGER
jgi:hypothetical protein